MVRTKQATDKIKVVYFTRKPRSMGNFSIETYFSLIREGLPQEFEPLVVEMPFFSNGIFKRLVNAVYCFFRQGDINHITGDIHYVAAFLNKQKTILTIHDCGLLHNNKGIRRAILKFFWFSWPVSRVTCVTAVSSATKSDIIAHTGCPPEKIQVIHVCVNRLFSKSEKVFNSDCPRILQIGTAENKNLSRLIRALEGISCTLVIIGETSDNIRQLIGECGIKAKIIDRRLSNDEIYEQYLLCDIVAMVSTLEGFGMPIVEGNIIGRPVLAGDNTSMPEIAGDGALLVNAHDVDDIRKGITAIIEDPERRRRLIENGYKNATRYLPEPLTMKYVVLYRSLLSCVLQSD